MRKIAKSLVFVGLCFGFTFLASCRENAESDIALAESKLDFVEGKADTKTIAVKTGTADEVDPKEVEGLTAVVEEKAIKVTATDKVKAGSHEFTVKGNKGKSSATFTVTVAKAASPDAKLPGSHGRTNDSQDVNSLVLEHNTIEVPPGSVRFVKVVKGKFQSAVPDPAAPFISVKPDTQSRLRITAAFSAKTGVFKVALKGKVGPDAELKVWIPPPFAFWGQPFDLKMEQSTIELTEGMEETKVVKVAAGWATKARVLPKETEPVEGLDAKVEDKPIHVIPTCAGFGYNADQILTVAGTTAKLKVTSVDDDGSIKGIDLVSVDKYLPSKRSVNLKGEGGSGMDAMFDLTNNVSIIADGKQKAGTYQVEINGCGEKTGTLQVIVNPANKTSAEPRVAPPGRFRAGSGQLPKGI